MDRKILIKRAAALLLALCLLSTAILGIIPIPVSAETTGCDVYFLNSNGWETVGAYVYGDKGELLGSWGSTDAVPAPELGGDWMKVTVTALPPYSVIFYNKADETQRAELLLDASDKLYVTAGAEAFTTQADAEAAAGVTVAIDPNNRDYGPNVEVIDVMVAGEKQPEESRSWVLPVTGVCVAALAAAAWALLGRKKKTA